MKLKLLMILTLMSLFVSCTKEDEETVESGGNEQTIPRDGGTSPLPSDPSPEPTPEPDPTPGPTPIKGKNAVIIYNRFDETVTEKQKKDSKGYIQTGEWKQSRILGFKNTISRYSDDVDAQVSYESNKIGNDNYCVSVHRVTHPNSIDKASLSIYDGESLLSQSDVKYNLSEASKGWHHLGVFNFSGLNTAKVVLKRGEESNSGFLRADEVRFKKIKPGYDCLGKIAPKLKKKKILDNKKNELDPTSKKKDSVGYRQFGNWEQSRLAGFKDSISRYSNDSQAYTTYTVKPTLDNYCLSIYKVTYPGSSDSAVVSIKQGDVIIDEKEISFDAAESEKGWEDLGRYYFNTEENIVVTLKQADSLTEGNGVLRADAFKFNTKGCED